MACDHRGCRCKEGNVQREGKSFCSEACATAQTANRHQAKCPCGHPDCQGH
jgi:hypothetical protein